MDEVPSNAACIGLCKDLQNYNECMLRESRIVSEIDGNYATVIAGDVWVLALLLLGTISSIAWPLFIHKYPPTQQCYFRYVAVEFGVEQIFVLALVIEPIGFKTFLIYCYFLLHQFVAHIFYSLDFKPRTISTTTIQPQAQATRTTSMISITQTSSRTLATIPSTRAMQVKPAAINPVPRSQPTLPVLSFDYYCQHQTILIAQAPFILLLQGGLSLFGKWGLYFNGVRLEITLLWLVMVGFSLLIFLHFAWIIWIAKLLKEIPLLHLKRNATARIALVILTLGGFWALLATRAGHVTVGSTAIEKGVEDMLDGTLVSIRRQHAARLCPNYDQIDEGARLSMLGARKGEVEEGTYQRLKRQAEKLESTGHAVERLVIESGVVDDQMDGGDQLDWYRRRNGEQNLTSVLNRLEHWRGRMGGALQRGHTMLLALDLVENVRFPMGPGICNTSSKFETSSKLRDACAPEYAQDNAKYSVTDLRQLIPLSITIANGPYFTLTDVGECQLTSGSSNVSAPIPSEPTFSSLKRVPRSGLHILKQIRYQFLLDYRSIDALIKGIGRPTEPCPNGDDLAATHGLPNPPLGDREGCVYLTDTLQATSYAGQGVPMLGRDTLSDQVDSFCGNPLLLRQYVDLSLPFKLLKDVTMMLSGLLLGANSAQDPSEFLEPMEYYYQGSIALQEAVCQLPSKKEVEAEGGWGWIEYSNAAVQHAVMEVLQYWGGNGTWRSADDISFQAVPVRTCNAYWNMLAAQLGIAMAVDGGLKLDWERRSNPNPGSVQGTGLQHVTVVGGGGELECREMSQSFKLPRILLGMGSVFVLMIFMGYIAVRVFVLMPAGMHFDFFVYQSGNLADAQRTVQISKKYLGVNINNNNNHNKVSQQGVFSWDNDMVEEHEMQ